jgi:hypothetical protein
MARRQWPWRSLATIWSVVWGTTFFIYGWARVWQQHLRNAAPGILEGELHRALHPLAPALAIGLGFFWLLAINLYIYRSHPYRIWLLVSAAVPALVLGVKLTGVAGAGLLVILAGQWLEQSRSQAHPPGLQ